MGNRAQAVGWLVLLTLLVVILYPALFLGQQVAPEASLRSAAPWRLHWGPHPDPSPVALQAATGLGSRLAGIAREGFGLALWNPYVGGGRPGWLVSAHEGGAPLALLAAFLAAPGWTFTALIAVQIVAAFGAVFLLLRRLGLGPWPAAVAGTGYALSGAVTSHLLAPAGSALVLGPLALLPALLPTERTRRRLLAWSVVLVLLLASGPTALQFVALGVAFDIMTRRGRTARKIVVVTLAGVLALAALAPRLALQRARGEPGAPPVASRPAPSLASALALVRPFPSARPEDPYSPGADLSDPNVRGDGFLGLPLLLLAFLGLAATTTREQAFWPAVAVVSAGLAFAPSGTLAAVGAATRPFGVLALTAAVLAAHGTERLLHRLASDRGRAAAGVVVCTALLVRMLPGAAVRLPFAPLGENHLESPLPGEGRVLSSRVAALLDTLPPDVAEVLALPDVRAADLAGEPRYAALLEPDTDGFLPANRALASGLTRLGVGWLLEPLPLRVVSGQVFAQAVLATATLVTRGATAATYRVDVPNGATRLGLAGSTGAGCSVQLVARHRAVALATDTALDNESTSWTWVAVPHDWPAGASWIRILGPAPPRAPTITVAWDSSGLALDHEAMGVRVWRRGRVWPKTFLAGPAVTGAALRPSPSSGSVQLAPLSADRLEAEVDATEPARLVALVKFRPTLWRASVDGVPVPLQRAGGVWSAVPVAPGRHRVRLAARLPAVAWAASLGALAVMCCLAAWREHG